MRLNFLCSFFVNLAKSCEKFHPDLSRKFYLIVILLIIIKKKFLLNIPPVVFFLYFCGVKLNEKTTIKNSINQKF